MPIGSLCEASIFCYSPFTTATNRKPLQGLFPKIQTFSIRSPTLIVRIPTFPIRTPMFPIRKATFFVRSPTFIIRNPTLTVRTPTLCIRSATFPIRKATFLIRKQTLSFSGKSKPVPSFSFGRHLFFPCRLKPSHPSFLRSACFVSQLLLYQTFFHRILKNLYFHHLILLTIFSA